MIEPCLGPCLSVVPSIPILRPSERKFSAPAPPCAPAPTLGEGSAAAGRGRPGVYGWLLRLGPWGLGVEAAVAANQRRLGTRGSDVVRQRSDASVGSGRIYGGGAAAAVHQWRGGEGGGEGVRRTAGCCRQERKAMAARATAAAAAAACGKRVSFRAGS